LATSHLLDLGRKAIGHIGGPTIVHAKRREKGWRDTLKTRGVKASPDWFVPAGFMESDGYRAMKRLLSVRPRIDAVFAVNDPAAIGAMKAIWEAGLRVPDDIAVVGVGDIALSDLLKVPLTTVGWSRKDQGLNAAELLLNGLDNDDKEPPRRVIIPPRLVVRESSGKST
jgi:LacI family transcriptional regulator